jgi:hypothetical protein
MDATEAAALHPDLHIAFRNLALATEREKLRALQDAAIQFSSAVAAGEVLKSDAVDALCSAASNHGLYSRYSGVEIEHLLGWVLRAFPACCRTSGGVLARAQAVRSPALLS